MAVRTTSRWITFQHDFRLGTSAEVFPAGRYKVEDDEEVVETSTRTVARYIGSFLIVTGSGSTRMCGCAKSELDEALEADALAR